LADESQYDTVEPPGATCACNTLQLVPSWSTAGFQERLDLCLRRRYAVDVDADYYLIALHSFVVINQSKALLL
jgi:hypothetical protein